jgi:hypothetical protein
VQNVRTQLEQALQSREAELADCRAESKLLAQQVERGGGGASEQPAGGASSSGAGQEEVAALRELQQLWTRQVRARDDRWRR